jgi:regulator of cell morphogenesis and NO signaling
MFLKPLNIEPAAFVSDIVASDYRTAEIFKQYGIEYCCGAKWPLKTVCQLNGLDLNKVIQSLNEVSRTIVLPNFLPFDKWDIDFLTDYIVHIHHYYLKKELPHIAVLLHHFIKGHSTKYPELNILGNQFDKFMEDALQYIKEEEEIIFPYVRQVSHGYTDRDPYAKLLVKTLRKPINKIMDFGERILIDIIPLFRNCTQNYTPPVNACVSHRVVFAKLKELDNDLVHHIYLENRILFPRTIAMEKEISE